MYLPRIKFGFCVLGLERPKQLEDHSQPENTPDFHSKIIIYPACPCGKAPRSLGFLALLCYLSYI